MQMHRKLMNPNSKSITGFPSMKLTKYWDFGGSEEVSLNPTRTCDQC